MRAADMIDSRRFQGLGAGLLAGAHEIQDRAGASATRVSPAVRGANGAEMTPRPGAHLSLAKQS
jgi:hypothetical protein